MSCVSRVLRNRELLFERFMGKLVRVEASSRVVEGKLQSVEASEHNGFGNIILETKEGLVLVRGSNVQSISEVEKRG